MLCPHVNLPLALVFGLEFAHGALVHGRVGVVAVLDVNGEVTVPLGLELAQGALENEGRGVVDVVDVPPHVRRGAGPPRTE